MLTPLGWNASPRSWGEAVWTARDLAHDAATWAQDTIEYRLDLCNQLAAVRRVLNEATAA
jgi:hypothetical protein